MPDKKTKINGFILSLLIFLLGIFNLDNNCNWGDDYAAYLTDGIAIATGNYEEQISINAFLRFGNDGNDSVHVHAIGMPLIHSLVYSLFGFDRCNFGNLFLYKLPSLIFFSAMCGFYFLFLRKRFDVISSVALTLAACCSMEYFYAIRNLGNDVIYMSVVVIIFYEAELFLGENKRKPLTGVALGILMWFAVSVRLNGISILLLMILLHILYLRRQKNSPKTVDAIPYAVFGLLFLVINCLIFRLPTSTSSVSAINLQDVVEGSDYYFQQLYNFFYTLVNNALIEPLQFAIRIIAPQKNPVTLYSYLNVFITYAVFGLMFIGLIVSITKGEIAYSIYAFASFFITAGLRLGQQLRYLYIIIPIMVTFLGFGISFIRDCFKGKIIIPNKIKSITCFVCSAALCCFIAIPVIRDDIENIKANNREPLTAYSDYAVEAYNYIENNVSQDSIIAFFKPRALYLNTGILSFLPGKNGMDVEDGDYYLYYKPDPDFLLPDETSFSAVFENEEFKLFKKIG